MRFSRSLRRTDLALRVSGIALAGALAAAASPALGQVAGNPAPAPSDQATDDAGSDIVVSGFRASLQSATAKKKNVDQVVESVTAEDIGKLPDASIAESIARLPGLTSQRLSGRSNSISIRGFSPDFSTTLLNGREQTSTGDNRAVEYDQYPSEVVNSVLVYKTPMASIIGQGLSGTVDLRTIRPIEFKRKTRSSSVGARASYADLGKLNAGVEATRATASTVRLRRSVRWTTRSASRSRRAISTSRIRSTNSMLGAMQGLGPNGSAPYVIGGSEVLCNTSTVLKRLGLQGTIEWKPTRRASPATLDGVLFELQGRPDQARHRAAAGVRLQECRSVHADQQRRLYQHRQVRRRPTCFVNAGTFTQRRGRGA